MTVVLYGKLFAFCNGYTQGKIICLRSASCFLDTKNSAKWPFCSGNTAFIDIGVFFGLSAHNNQVAITQENFTGQILSGNERYSCADGGGVIAEGDCLGNIFDARLHRLIQCQLGANQSGSGVNARVDFQFSPEFNGYKLVLCGSCSGAGAA